MTCTTCAPPTRISRLRDKTALTDGLLSVCDTSWSVNGAFAYGWDDTEQEYIDLHLPTDAATPQLTDSTHHRQTRSGTGTTNAKPPAGPGDDPSTYSGPIKNTRKPADRPSRNRW